MKPSSHLLALIRIESWLNDAVEFPKPPVGVSVEEAIILTFTSLSEEIVMGISFVWPGSTWTMFSSILTLNGIGDDVFNIPNLFSVHSLNQS